MVQRVYKDYCQDLDAIICEKNIEYINGAGNVEVDQDSHVYYLYKNGRITKSYYYLEYIGNDQFIVCDAIYNCKTDLSSAEYWDDVDYNLCFRQGVIRIKRDEKGEIIPFAEETIVPILYNQIITSNSNTVKALYKEKYTFYDVDILSTNYGRRLCPLILDDAGDFDLEYDGYVECRVGNKTGYLSRASKEYRVLSADDLLTVTDIQAEYYDIDSDNKHLIEQAFIHLTYQTDGDLYLRRAKK